MAENAWDGLCRELQYAPQLHSAGLKIIQRLSSSDQQQTDTKGQLAAAAYFAILQISEPTASITQLLGHLCLSMKDFFFHVDELHTLLCAGQYEQDIKRLKSQYVVTTCLFDKYKLYFHMMFPDGFAGKDTELHDASFRLGWTLFAFVKSSVLGKKGGGELLSAYHLLACVFQLLLTHLPEAARTAPGFWPQLADPVPFECFPMPDHAHTLLCSQLKADPGEMARLQGRMVAVLNDLKRLLAKGDSGSPGLGGILHAESLKRTLEIIDEQYQHVWSEGSELDDRYVLSSAPAAAPTPRRAASVPSSPCHQLLANQSLLTPLRGPHAAPSRVSALVAGTPISSQLESVGWLKEAVQTRAATIEPETKLKRYYEQCEHSPELGIRERLQRLCERVQRHLEASELPCDVEERCGFARKLYYKMLLSFLEAEARRLSTNNFTSLLSNESFHCSLFACCTEAVFATYSMSHVAFPKILELVDLHAFDLGKVIESFVVQEGRLPQHLKTHFLDVDSRILEALAWGDGSPLHRLMEEYDLSNSAKKADGTPLSSNVKKALEQFLMKVKYLAAARIQEMCTRLLLPSVLVQQVWECLKVVIHQAHHLLQGRHLDQLIMCTVYGVCKVNQRQVTFRHIIEQYKRQPKAAPEVFRQVRMRSVSEPPADIISFYNQIFIPALKDQLMHICNNAGQGATSSQIGESRGSSSPQKASARHEVYVSQQRPPSSMTPRTRTLFHFGNTPHEKLDKINKQLKSAPRADGADVAAHSLRQLRSTPPSRQAAEESPKKRPRDSQEEKGNTRKSLAKRLVEQGAGSSNKGQASSPD